MPCFLCGRKANQHVAVASRAGDSSAPSGAKSKKHGQKSDRGFDDDKAALQRWRQQHSPTTSHDANQHQNNEGISNEVKATTTTKATPKAAAVAAKGKKKRKCLIGSKQEKDKSSSSSSNSSGSGSSSGYNLGIDETKKPVMMSPRAVQAWQQKQQQGQAPPAAPVPPVAQPQQPQTPSSPTGRKSLKQDLRSPYEVSSVSSGHSADSSSLHSRPINQPKSHKKKPPRTQHNYGTGKQLDKDEVTSYVVTPDASPLSPVAPVGTPSHPRTTTAVTSQPPPQQYASSPHVQHGSNTNTTSTTSSSRVLPQRAPIPRSRSWRRQHDHESLKDQMIRDVVLRQNSSSGNSSSNSSSSNSGERIRGQVFLQVHPRDAISPRSSLAEDTGDTDSEYLDDTASVSDIFSDHHLSSAFANNTSMDSESRERYILACRLLRARMMQPHPPPIMPMERELLHDLLDRFQHSPEAGSQVAYETLAKILAEDDNDNDDDEAAAAAVDNDRLPVAYSRSHSNASANSRQSSGANLLDISRDGDLTVASIREEETGFGAVLKHHSKHNSGHPQQQQQQHLPPTYPRAQSWRDEKNPKAMPELVEDDDKLSSASLKLPVEEPTSSMIRLDGWNLATREQFPFEIMGLDGDTPPATRVLTPALMESLRGFFPYAVSEDNFWLKFSLVRDGASLRSLLRKCMASQHTIICVETNDGDVFGSFCSSPWQSNDHQKWFGSGEAFLWRLKQSRYVRDSSDGNRQLMPSNEMEVYPFTGNDDMVQYCTSSTLAIGGGSWNDTVCPYRGEPTGIGLMVDGDLEGGETNSCATFANPRLYGRSTSSNEFTIRNLEVWTLTPCNSIPLAEQLERQKYFIREHTETSVSPRQQRLPAL